MIRNTSRDWPIEFVEAEYRPKNTEDRLHYGQGRRRYGEDQPRHTLGIAPARLRRRRDRPADRIHSWSSNVPLHVV